MGSDLACPTCGNTNPDTRRECCLSGSYTRSPKVTMGVVLTNEARASTAIDKDPMAQTFQEDRTMNAEEAIKQAQAELQELVNCCGCRLHSTNQTGGSCEDCGRRLSIIDDLQEASGAIRRQADDLAAIEKYHRTNGMPPIASHIGEPNEPDEWVVLHTENLSYHPTLADACRAATKGAG